MSPVNGSSFIHHFCPSSVHPSVQWYYLLVPHRSYPTAIDWILVFLPTYMCWNLIPNVMTFGRGPLGGDQVVPKELGVWGGRYPALTFQKLSGTVKIRCCGHGFSLLPSLCFISLPRVPRDIKQECFVKISGPGDIFSFIFSISWYWVFC